MHIRAHMDCVGLAVHTGAPRYEVLVYDRACKTVADIARPVPGSLRVKRLDLGGGLCVPIQRASFTV